MNPVGPIVWLYHGLAWTWGGFPFRSGAAGYNIFSGPLGDLPMLGVFIVLWRRHNCHSRGCWRIQWHTAPDGHVYCRRHHPEGDAV